MTTPTDVSARSCSGSRDLDAMYRMTATLPNALHHADLPWRLTSPAAQEPARTRLWENRDGTLLAWAILQFPWHCLDYDVRPGPHRQRVEQAVLDWAVGRLTTEAASRNQGLPFYIGSRADDAARLGALRRAGFHADGWSYLHLSRDLGEPIPEPGVPDGFHVRALNGEAEVDAYVTAHRAAFGSTNMTADWRRRTILDPRYTAELDLVAISPDGDIVGFCVGWITPRAVATTETRVAQVEPVGVLPGFQRLGLGRALLLEGLHRARTIGAGRMEVDAESYNQASRDLYASVGYRQVFEAPFARRTFGSPARQPVIGSDQPLG